MRFVQGCILCFGVFYLSYGLPENSFCSFSLLFLSFEALRVRISGVQSGGWHYTMIPAF